MVGLLASSLARPTFDAAFLYAREYFISLKGKLTDGGDAKETSFDIFHSEDGLREALYRISGSAKLSYVWQCRLPPPPPPHHGATLQ